MSVSITYRACFDREVTALITVNDIHRSIYLAASPLILLNSSCFHIAEIESSSEANDNEVLLVDVIDWIACF